MGLGSQEFLGPVWPPTSLQEQTERVAVNVHGSAEPHTGRAAHTSSEVTLRFSGFIPASDHEAFPRGLTSVTAAWTHALREAAAS